MTRSLLPLLLALALGGCHTYQPIPVRELAPGSDVRVRLSGAYADSLAAVLQRDDARILEGTVVGAGGSSVLLEVPVEQSLRGMRLQTLNQRVEIPETAFLETESKELDRGRTFLAVGAAAAVASTIVVLQLTKDSGGSSNQGPGGGPVEAVVSTDLLGSLVGGVLHLLGR